MSGVERPTPQRKNTIDIKILGTMAVLLLVAMGYNQMTSWQGVAGNHRNVYEAAVPLQKQPRKSRFAHKSDPDEPETIVVTPLGAPRRAGAQRRAQRAERRAQQLASSKPPRPPPPPLPKGLRDEFATKVDGSALALAPEMAGLSCHAREGYDIAGDAAYVWGLAFNVDSAAECCAACAMQRKVCGEPGSRGKPFWRASRRERTQGRCSGAPGVCNAWVFCPGSSDTPGANDRCFSYTIHNHSRGECWLKHEKNQSHPIAAGPTLPLKMRNAPRADWPWPIAVNVWPWAVPEKIHWQAGLLAPTGAATWRGTELPDWHHKFCRGKHGPC